MGFRGGGGVINLRCCLQTKMMFFGRWMMLAYKDDVLRWMMNVFVRGVGWGGWGGELLTFVECSSLKTGVYKKKQTGSSKEWIQDLRNPAGR